MRIADQVAGVQRGRRVSQSIGGVHPACLVDPLDNFSVVDNETELLSVDDVDMPIFAMMDDIDDY